MNKFLNVIALAIAYTSTGIILLFASVVILVTMPLWIIPWSIIRADEVKKEP